MEIPRAWLPAGFTTIQATAALPSFDENHRSRSQSGYAFVSMLAYLYAAMSEQYIVSARKYRPQTFDTVVGQSHITTTLKNAIRQEHLAHAYLFTGPRGLGKTTCARILAKTINCENPTSDTEACGVCRSCQSFSNQASFNVFELDAASNNSVDDIRELTGQVRFAPQQGRYKVYIIDEVHMLSAAAFNAFLKTLEEPPSYAIFILATTEKHKILPTILSRCQIFDFKRITSQDIVHHLHGIATREGMVAQEAALHIIAQKSEGCMRDALSMLDRIASFTNGQLTYNATLEHLAMLDAAFYFRLTDSMLSQDVTNTLLQLHEAIERGFEGNIILEGLAEHLRNMLLCKDARMVKLLDIPGEHKNLYLEKARQLPPSFILSALHQLNEAELHFRNATNKRLHVEMCLIRLCYITQLSHCSEKKNTDPQLKPAPSIPPVQVVPQPIPPKNTVETPATPLPMAQAPQPTQNATSIPQVEQVPKPVPLPSGAGRRISKGILDDVELAVSQAQAAPVVTLAPLTEEEIQNYFAGYLEKLRQESKSSLHAQFCMMRATLTAPDEMKIYAPNALCEEYAKAQRDDLINYFRAATSRVLRIVTEVDKSMMSDEPEIKVLSKPEMYEVMAQKNPNLVKLKDALGLIIEY